MIKPMRERNQVTVAVVGTLLLAAVLLVAVNLNSLPFLNPTHTYYADFADANGLKSGDDVRVEGVSVGSVESVGVQGDHVHVAFTVRSSLRLGDQSRASIEIATVLGNLFMQVESAGSGRLSSGATIPTSRTAVPYTLLGALNTLGTFAQDTDLGKLRTSLSLLSQNLAGVSPGQAGTALTGLAALARTVADKQSEISAILNQADAVVGTLNRNSGALVALLTQGDEFLRLIQDRSLVIGQLLQDTARLGTELRDLMTRDGAQLGRLLTNLDSVTAVLAKEKAQLQRAVVNLGQFSVNIANATGAGPWADLLVPVGVRPDSVIAGCGPDVASIPSGQKPCQ